MNMKYPKNYLEEIKLRLKVSQIVGKTVKLKRRGKEFIGLSPFTTEKTPSFTVSDEKGFYHCFSSGEHGNIFLQYWYTWRTFSRSSTWSCFLNGFWESLLVFACSPFPGLI